MRCRFIMCGCLAFSLCQGTTTTYTWTGISSNNMSQSGNWDSAGVPVNSTSSILTFPSGPSNVSPNNNIASNFLFDAINFASSYTLTGNSFLIPGSFGASITFSSGSTAIEAPMNISASSSALNVFNSSGVNNTIGDTNGGGLAGGGVLNIVQGGITVGGTTTFTGTINITGNSAHSTSLTAGGAGSLGTAGFIPALINLTEPGGTSNTAVLNLNGYAQTIGGISGTTGTTVNAGAANLTLSNFGSYQTPFYGALNGTGSLLLQNSANLALLGNVSGYSGPVALASGGALFTNTLGGITSFTINGGGGTLQLQLGSTATMSNNITMNDTTTIATNGNTITYNGTLSGSGSLVKLGSGTLALSGGTSNNTGPVLIEGGILNVSATTLPSTVGAITFQGYAGTLQASTNMTVNQPITLDIAGTIDTNGHNVTMGGPISGGSQLIKSGEGIMTLGSAGNDYTGKTVIKQGTLNGTSSTFIVVNPTTNPKPTPQLVFQVPSDAVGTFQAGSDFSDFSSNMILISNGIIDTNSYDITLNGVLAGAGTLTLMGTGSLSLTNPNNTFTGNIQINNGTLSAPSSTIPSVSGTPRQIIFADTGNGIFQAESTYNDFNSDVQLQSDGTIDTQNNNLTFSGSLIGEPTYTLHKLGTGTVTFNGQGYFGGLLNVVEGQVYSNGLAAYDVAVNSGTIFKGTGIHSGSVVVADGATIAPGNSVGTMTIGTLTLNSGSTTSIEIDAMAASTIDVTGAATIAGTLEIEPDLSPYPHQGRYLILSADTMSGTFSSIRKSPGFTFGLTYLLDEIYLNYSLAIPTDGLTDNLLIVANYLNTYAPPSSEYTALAELTGEALESGLNGVSPARNGFGPFTAAETMMVIDEMVYTHLADRRFLSLYNQKEKGGIKHSPTITAYLADASNTTMALGEKNNPYTIWIDGFWQTANQSAEDQNPSFAFTSEGGILGFDYSGVDEIIFGGGVGYAHSGVVNGWQLGSASINYYFASLYATSDIDNFYLEEALFAAYNPIINKRNIVFSTYNYVAKANIQDWQLDLHLGFGYDAIYGWGGIEPFVSVDWAANWEGSFTETGANALNMSQTSRMSSFLQSEAGLRFYQIVKHSYGSVGFKEAVSYVNRVFFRTGKVTAAITGSNTYFTLSSLTTVQNLGVVSGEIFALLGKQQSCCLSLNYQGEFGSGYISNELFVRIAQSF